MGIETVIGIVAGLGSLAATASNAFGGKGSQTPQIAAAPVPAGPEADLSPDQIEGRYSPGTGAPNFLQFGSGMTNAQKRAQIATFGSFGSDSRYSDPATKDYFKNLLLQDYADSRKSGTQFSFLPAERQYAEKILGAKPRYDTNESFLSAILRG